MFEKEFSDCQVRTHACVYGCWWGRQENDLREMGRRAGFIAPKASSFGSPDGDRGVGKTVYMGTQGEGQFRILGGEG